LPLITLIVIFFITHIAASDIVGMDVWLIHGMMKALFAWIVIRCIVQFIENGAVRNSFATIIWSIAALSIFGALDEATKILDGIGLDIGTFHLSLLTVAKGAFFLFILVYFASFVATLIEHRILKSKHLTKSSKILIGKIVRVALIVLALLLGITSSGIDLSLFAVFGGAIGLGVGFGLQKGIANLFSGMMLLFDRSIQPGDIIELDNGVVGKIEQMAARYTEIVTLENKSILIPNEEFVSKSVINWSHGNSLIRVSVKFGVHYDSDPHQVIKVAVDASKKVNRVLSHPNEPACFMTDFGDSAINFTLGFWIKDPENGLGNVRGDVLLALWDAFKEHDISIPYPHREVFVHKVAH
jgi:small-conductance mechanosensitive channel